MSEAQEFHELVRAVGRIEGLLERIVHDADTVRTKQYEMEKQLNWARGGLAALGAATTIFSVPQLIHFLK